MNLLTFYISICVSVILGVGSVFAYWLLYPYEPFTFYTEKNPVLTPVVKVGEQVVWKTDVYHHTNGKLVEISRSIEDGYLINLPDTSYKTESGRRTFNNSSVTIPTFTPPGTYHIAIYNTVHVNPLRSIVVKRVTEDFKVER